MKRVQNLLLTSILFCLPWTTTFSFLSPLTSFQEDIFDSLDYFNKKISLNVSAMNRIALRYEARLSYKGSGGDETKPFTGFEGSLETSVTLAKGLKIDPLQADRMQELMKSINVEQFLNVSPTHECAFKLIQLFFTTARGEISQQQFSDELYILMKRASNTPSCGQLTFKTFPIIGTATSPGYLDALARMPRENFERATRWIFKGVNKLGVLLALAPQRKDQSPHKPFDYTRDTELLLFKEDDAYAKIVFGYHHVGNPNTPFNGALLDVSLPFAESINALSSEINEQSPLHIPLNLRLPLNPTIECLIKMFFAFQSARAHKLSPSEFIKDLEVLTHKLLITEEKTDFSLGFGKLFSLKLIGTQDNPGILRLFAQRSHDIFHYDFTLEHAEYLSPKDLVLFLLALAYKTTSDLTALRTKLVGEIQKSPEGATLLTKLQEAQNTYDENPSQETKQLLKQQWQMYRAMEMEVGKDDYQKILDFIMIQSARALKRLPQWMLAQQLLLGIPFLRELAIHDITFDTNLFWQTLAGQHEGTP